MCADNSPSFDDPLTEGGRGSGYKTGWRYFRRGEARTGVAPFESGKNNLSVRTGRSDWPSPSAGEFVNCCFHVIVFGALQRITQASLKPEGPFAFHRQFHAAGP